MQFHNSRDKYRPAGDGQIVNGTLQCDGVVLTVATACAQAIVERAHKSGSHISQPSTSQAIEVFELRTLTYFWPLPKASGAVSIVANKSNRLMSFPAFSPGACPFIFRSPGRVNGPTDWRCLNRRLTRMRSAAPTANLLVSPLTRPECKAAHVNHYPKRKLPPD
jgi:hypothetical protein